MLTKPVAGSITVVIPSYNRAATLHRSIISVLRQTFPPSEVIVVDDCSTDHSVEVVKSIRDPRIRSVVLDMKSGAQVARNVGIRQARGDWIAFQDSDDEWLPEKLEKQLCALEHVGYDPWTVIHADAVCLDGVTGERRPYEVRFVEGDNVYSNLLGAPGPLFPTIVVSRIALERVGLLDEDVPAYQEWDTVIRLSEHCRFIHIHEPLFVYHLHKGETISKDKGRDIRGYLYILNKFEREIRRVCGSKSWDRHLLLQLSRSIEFGLLAEFDLVADRIAKKGLAFKTLQICRIMDARPSVIAAWRRWFGV